MVSAPGRTAVTRVARPSATPTYRAEIEGLRAVAVLLVAVYHIWLGRVSGGVDVFLMLTGFLITGSLLRSVERTGRVEFPAFAARLARRLLPPAALVLAGVLIGTLLFLPRTRWSDTLSEVLASAFYYENWQLATSAVDYLANDAAASPVQHFWSLGIQGQFYLIWPLLLALSTVLATRTRRRPEAVFLAVNGVVFAVSLTYSVLRTAENQPWAYFDTGARLWELALGGILAIVLPRLRVPHAVGVALGWIGLVALVACGLVLQVSTVFPGYAALWPTGAAVMIIIAGVTGGRFAADRLLTLRPLAYVGGVSYALYLWHWPILVFYLAATERTVASIKGGLFVLAVSFALAAVTTRVTGGSMRGVRRARPAVGRSIAVGLACLLPVVAVTTGWSAYLAEQARQRAALAADPEAAARSGLGIVPDPADAADDRPITYANGCNQVTHRDEVLSCRFGAEKPSRTIALVGNSHAAHWFPALHEIVEKNGWQLVNYTKGACALSADPQRYQGRPYPSCDRWQRGVLAELSRLRPDVVVTTATESSLYERGETMPRGYVERWRQLGAMGINVLAIRDTPRMAFDPPECVATKGADRCVTPERRSLAERSPVLDLRRPPKNVHFADFNDVFCTDGRCPSVINGILVYSDVGHITATFMRTLAPRVERELKRALPADGNGADGGRPVRTR